jgi:hypothetical protein
LLWARFGSILRSGHLCLGITVWINLRNFPDRIRWWLFLPAAFAAAIPFYALIAVVNRVLPNELNDDPRTILTVFLSVLLGASFVFAGAYVAPRVSPLVCIGLAFVPVSAGALLIYLALGMTGFLWGILWNAILAGLCCIGGSVFAAVAVARPQHPLER